MPKFLSIFLCLFLCITAYAQPEFPALTGRVVDNANLLSATTRTELTALLAQHEQETSNQVVVVTIPTLSGYEISDYGYQLGRHWGIGQKDKDNGALLLVALAEKKVRIEVGYGLEGALTDALSSQIIRNEITPKFKQGGFDQGIKLGTQSILGAIQGEYLLEEKTENGGSIFEKIIPFIMFGSVGGQIFVGQVLGYRRKKRNKKIKFFASAGVGTVVGIVGGIVLTSITLGLLAALGASVLSYLFFGNKSHNRSGGGGSLGGGGSFGGGSGGGFSGGGFSGGGGGFGGGGASGGW